MILSLSIFVSIKYSRIYDILGYVNIHSRKLLGCFHDIYDPKALFVCTGFVFTSEKEVELRFFLIFVGIATFPVLPLIYFCNLVFVCFNVSFYKKK